MVQCLRRHVFTAANKASLRDLVALGGPELKVERVTALCRALPLCRVRCCVHCYTSVEALLPLLRREPPHELLTINAFVIDRLEGGKHAVLDLASALSVYEGMERLHYYEDEDAQRTGGAFVNALVDAAISAGIKNMMCFRMPLSQTALPALTRLLQSPGFEELHIWNRSRDNYSFDPVAIFKGCAMPAFCEALRNSKSLKELKLHDVNLWANMAAGCQFIAALEGHPALQKFSLHGDLPAHTHVEEQAIGECLARLVADRPPPSSTCLRVLQLPGHHLDLIGMTPVLQALRCTSVTALSFGTVDGEAFNEEYARDVVLPAVRASSSLRALYCERWHADDDEEYTGPLPAMDEVEDILEARRLADAEAA